MLTSARVTRRHTLAPSAIPLRPQVPPQSRGTGWALVSGTGVLGLSAEQSSWRLGLRGGSLASLGKSWGAWGLSGLRLPYSHLTLISFLYLDLFLVFSGEKANDAQQFSLCFLSSFL